MAFLRVGLAALTFALFWLLSHRLSTAQLGGFSLLMNTFFMVQALPLLGMTMPLMRRVASRPQEMQLEISNAYFFALPVGAAIGLGVACAGQLFANESLFWPFALLGASILPTAWTVVAEAALVGSEKMHFIAYANLLEAAGRLLGSWLVVSWGFGLVGVFFVFVALRCAIALSYVLNPSVPLPRWRLVARPMMQRNLQEVPTYLSIALVTALCTRLDIILLAKLLSLRDAGVYAAAARLSDAALMIPTMAAVVIFPSQSRLFEADRAAFARILERAVRWCSIAGFSLTLVVIALAPTLIHYLYAPSLAAAAPIWQTLTLGAPIMVIDQIMSTTMIAARSQHADLRSMSVGLVTLVTFLLALTHSFGLLGAAFAVPAALLVRVVYRLIWAQRAFSVPLLRAVLPVMLAAAGSVLVFHLHFASNDAANLAMALLFYAASLWVTSAVPAADWQSMRQLLSKAPSCRT